MLLAHFHDAPEYESGDVSGGAKRLYPELARVSHEVDREIIERSLFNDLPDELAERYRGFARLMTGVAADSIEQQIVKYADKMEALKFAETEVKIGNTLMAEVVTEIKVECRELQWPWLIALRKEMGLP